MANHAFGQRPEPQSLDRRQRRRHQQHAQRVGVLIQETYLAEQPQIDQTGRHLIDRLESKSRAETDHLRALQISHLLALSVARSGVDVFSQAPQQSVPHTYFLNVSMVASRQPEHDRHEIPFASAYHANKAYPHHHLAQKIQIHRDER